jgi:hypothetical protein
MTSRPKKVLIGVAAIAALGLGGGAIAGATGGGEPDDRPLTGTTAEKASAAALDATGGGRVNEMEADTENGATYEVEVTRPDGSEVDVRLDEGFDVVVVEGDGDDDGED